MSTPRVGFLHNVVWNWIGSLATIVAGFFISPLIIRALGADDYGLWVVATALMDYYWLLDFGLRSATVRFTAHHQASGEFSEFNRTVATTIAYSFTLMPILIAAAWLGGPALGGMLHIQHPLFPQLLLIVVSSMMLTALMSTFTAALEGLQRFDVINQAAVFIALVRAVGIVVLLQTGYGLIPMALLTAATQFLLHAIAWMRLRGVVPEFSLAPRFVSFAKLREMLRYGVHSVVSSLGQRILSQSPPLIITYFLSERFAGYFVNPRMLLDYTAEAVMRIGNVSNSRAAELLALGRRTELLRFAESVNRFSLAAFLPLAAFLMIYGRAFLLVWIGEPTFVSYADGVLFALLPGYIFGFAGQYSSQSVLFGMGRHQQVSRALLAEAVVSVIGWAFLLPNYGLVAGTIWNSVLLILNRALLTPWLLNRELGGDFVAFIAGVNRPVLALLPTCGALLLLQRFLPGDNWPQLIAAGACSVMVYLPSVFYLIPADDRKPLFDRARALLGRFSNRAVTQK